MHSHKIPEYPNTATDKKRLIIAAIILGIVVLGTIIGAAHAANRSIQLNSAASFPVDI